MNDCDVRISCQKGHQNKAKRDVLVFSASMILLCLSHAPPASSLSCASSQTMSSKQFRRLLDSQLKIYDYIRYDLKEIAFPSSLPDPPHIQKRPKLTWEQHIWVVNKAARLYAASWVRDIGPDLRPNDYKKDENTDKPGAAKKPTKERELSTLEDLAVAARGGMETLRPALQRVYMTRASAYRDALKSFIEGYQEGVQQVMDFKTCENINEPKKST